MFRRIDDSKNTHVQICGNRFNNICKSLVNKKLQVEEEKLNYNKNKKKQEQTAKMMTQEPAFKKELGTFHLILFTICPIIYLIK